MIVFCSSIELLKQHLDLALSGMEGKCFKRSR